MSHAPRPCITCGRRIYDGESRCEEHRAKPYGRALSCLECGARTAGERYCPEHVPDPFGPPRSEAERLKTQPWRKGYRDPNYHRERNGALARAGGKCEKCGRSDLKLEVDHVVPLSSAKTPEELARLNVRANLRVLCVMCHRRKTRGRP